MHSRVAQSLYLTNCTSKIIALLKSLWWIYWRQEEKRKPVQWGRKLYPPCRSSIHQAHKAYKYRPYRVIKGGWGVRRAPEPAASHSASQESSSKLKKAPANEKLYQESRSHQGHTEASDPLSCALKTSGDRPTDKGKVTGQRDPLQHTVQLS